MTRVANDGAVPLRADRGIAAWLNVNVRVWQIGSLMLAALVVVPMLVVTAAWFTPAGDVWRHLADTVLLELLRNTVVLAVGVGAFVFVVGVGLAWLTTMYNFPGRAFFDWALMLPLAIPAYVLAFVWLGTFEYAGALPSLLRRLWGPADWLAPARGRAGVIVVMGLAFYPYVYMLARAAFVSQGRAMFETGRLLGLSPWAAFVRVALPMARPAIAAGVALALMETLADFGTVAIFNYDTFTTAIYKAWLGLFSLHAAAQLSSLLLLFVAVALIVERRARGRARYHPAAKPGRDARYPLRGVPAAGALAAATLVLGLAFVLPVAQLLVWATKYALSDLNFRYFSFVGNTLVLAAAGALVTTAGAVLLAYSYRLKPDRLTHVAVRFATLGYALPGSVLAVGIMLAFVWLDARLALFGESMFGVAPGPFLAGSLFALVLAYGVRFMVVAYGPVDSSFEGIRPAVLQAARSLGAGNFEILWRVALPMLRTGLWSAGLLVFVEVMKELPATLLLRPFGWDTLATRIFEWTSEGQWERAALPAVTLVAAGLIPVILLVRRAKG